MFFAQNSFNLKNKIKSRPTYHNCFLHSPSFSVLSHCQIHQHSAILFVAFLESMFIDMGSFKVFAQLRKSSPLCNLSQVSIETTVTLLTQTPWQPPTTTELIRGKEGKMEIDKETRPDQPGFRSPLILVPLAHQHRILGKHADTP